MHRQGLLYIVKPALEMQARPRNWKGKRQDSFCIRRNSMMMSAHCMNCIYCMNAHTASKAGQWSQDQTPACYQRKRCDQRKMVQLPARDQLTASTSFIRSREQCSETSSPLQLLFTRVYVVSAIDYVLCECDKFCVQNIQWVEKRFKAFLNSILPFTLKLQ